MGTMRTSERVCATLVQVCIVSCGEHAYRKRISFDAKINRLRYPANAKTVHHAGR